ncbi:outer membrane beta-barrel protein [Alcanivorax sp. 1008]|uniref:outer membrane beta-barrel protein n=1 Tax=Alcanivorax sp. 1008 TaxID=2816853 RepID=UPI001D358AB9|nr:outer membrane beta-barrel protein [Alcanivorax sp. 1008]MCC1496062.1 outer membrane beta-barrel protein [Alcanivorax sp. 1008]
MRGYHIFPVLLVGLCSAATAEIAVYRDAPNSYVATNIMMTNVQGGQVDQSQGGFSVRMGGMVDQNFGAEVRLARGLWHETQRLPGSVRLQIDVDHIAGVYAVGRLPFDVPLVELPLVDRLFVHALAGVADVRLRAEQDICIGGCGSTTVTRRSNLDFSWGLGIGAELKLPKVELPVLNMPRRVGLSLEYMNYQGWKDVDVTGIEAGVMVFF